MFNKIHAIREHVSLTLQLRREHKLIAEAAQRLLVERRTNETLYWLSLNEPQLFSKKV